MGFLAITSLVYSFYLGLVFNRKVAEAITRPRSGFRPRACLIMPCKGVDHGLRENIQAALFQDYPNYKLVMVADSAEDEAFSVAKAVLEKNPNARAELYVSEPIRTCSGKVAALLTALVKTKGEAEVYAFIDSDARAAPNWLSEMVDPLSDGNIGATTGFRWYFPVDGGFWSHVESAWNASGTNLLFDQRYNFPWGGGMAVRRETLDRVKIREIWENAISDDVALNRALRKKGYTVAFLPQCLVATYHEASPSSFLEWATRQAALTKVMSPRLWRYALVAYGFLDLTVILGMVSLVLGPFLGTMWFIPAAMLLTPAVLGLSRSIQRCATFKRALPHLRLEFEKNCPRGALASLTVPWIMAYCIIKSAFVHEIQWRSRTYPLTRTNLFSPKLD